jgi:signal transduction histidine kinase
MGLIAYCAITFSVAFLSILIGLFVIANNYRTPRNIVWFFLCLAIAGWNFGYAITMIPSVPYSTALLSSRLSHASGIIIPPLFLTFTLVFLKIAKEKRYALAASYAVSLGLAVSCLTNFVVPSLAPKMFMQWYPVGGIGYAVYIANFLFWVVYSHYLYLARFGELSGFEREQVKFFLIGTILGFFGGSNCFPLIFGIQIPPVLSVLIIVFPFSTAYAITRYRLMGIEMIIRKGMVYGLLTAIMSVLYFIIIYLSENIFKAVTGFSSLWFSIPAIFTLALMFEPTMSFLQRAIDKTFFKSRYIAEKTSKKFADGVKKLRTIEEFARFIARSAYVTLKLKGSAAYIFDERSELYTCLEAKGSLSPLKGNTISPDDAALRQMAAKRAALLKEETDMPEKDFYLCVPALSSGKNARLLGFLATDAKGDNTPFSVEEIELLEMLANQTASGIENALLYEQQIATIEKSLKLEKLASLGAATAGVAHEAKNALGFVSAFAQMLPYSDDKPKLVETHHKAFSNEVNRIKLILQGIQDYSKQTEQVAEEINIKGLADETIVLVRDQAKGKNVIIDNSVDGSLNISADRNRMKQVLLNLFMNAIEAMPSGGILSIRTEPSGQGAAVKISDTGTGIPKEILRKIFEPFYTTKQQGTGLGLAIVKRIVEENKGALSVDSEPGKGTTFTLAFGG